MKTKNHLKAWMILGGYLVATCVLLLLGYSVRKPAVKRQEFPFSITYSYQGETQTISDVYVVEHHSEAKYIGDDSIAWFGYIKDYDRRLYDYYEVVVLEDRIFSINVNFKPGYFMGDPAYADSVCQPTAQYNYFDGVDDHVVTDPAALEELGFSIVNWAYPAPIENAFSFGGVALSSEATVYTAVIAGIALLACLILIKKDRQLTYSLLDKFSVFLNLLIAVFALPFIFVASALSEIVASETIWQQILYFTPALTAISLAASLTLRRMGEKRVSLWIQFAGPVMFALCVLIESL